LKSAEYRVRLPVIRGHPSHRRTELSHLSEIRGPPQGNRAVPGHWEGDLILGSSAIGTLMERTTSCTLLLHLPRIPGHGDGARAKNGPALAGHGAAAVRDAITRTIITLPEALRRSLTWDQGAEMWNGTANAATSSRDPADVSGPLPACRPQEPDQAGSAR
jgi:IS30 family transposase